MICLIPLAVLVLDWRVESRREINWSEWRQSDAMLQGFALILHASIKPDLFRATLCGLNWFLYTLFLLPGV